MLHPNSALIIAVPYAVLQNSVCKRQSIYDQTFNISCTLIGNKLVERSDVVGALPVSAAPIISSFWT